MNETIISWKIENIFTITLMALLGFTILGFAIHVGAKLKGGSNDSH